MRPALTAFASRHAAAATVQYAGSQGAVQLPSFKLSRAAIAEQLRANAAARAAAAKKAAAAEADRAAAAASGLSGATEASQAKAEAERQMVAAERRCVIVRG